MENSECESADDTDAEQLATAHCITHSRVGEEAHLLLQSRLLGCRLPAEETPQSGETH